MYGSAPYLARRPHQIRQKRNSVPPRWTLLARTMNTMDNPMIQVDAALSSGAWICFASWAQKRIGGVGRPAPGRNTVTTTPLNEKENARNAAATITGVVSGVPTRSN